MSTVVSPAAAAAALVVAAALDVAAAEALTADDVVTAGADVAEAVVAGAEAVLAGAEVITALVVTATDADAVVPAAVPPQPANTSVRAMMGTSGRVPTSEDNKRMGGVSFFHLKRQDSVASFRRVGCRTAAIIGARLSLHRLRDA